LIARPAPAGEIGVRNAMPCRELASLAAGLVG
jgi:hypothetical protein